MSLTSLFVGLCGLASYCFSFLSICKLVTFLSSQSPPQHLHSSVLQSCIVDGGLLILFVLQHSVMNTEPVKNAFRNSWMENFERTFYVTCTNICLLLLTNLWEPIQGLDLWSVDTESNVAAWWAVTVVHGLMWYLIYTATLLLDITDLLGVKQLITHLSKEEDQTCPSLRRLYGHMRHPSFLALTLILWIHPLMSLDRFLLSFCLTGYMYLAWSPDLQDHTYQCTMWKNKTKILEASKL